MKKILIILIFIPYLLLAQENDTTLIKDKVKNEFFATLYSSFNYSKSTLSPTSVGFRMPTALLGYKKNITDNIGGTIILDVTRTTSNFSVNDTNGLVLPVSYFEGSKYTAFLKMAEIQWDISPKWSFSVGLLLNSQYLTVQDKFWNHRYVEVTFQELNRLGMPADFGMRMTFKPNKKFKINVGVFNGDGPFRHQDEYSSFLLSANLEYRPTELIILKAYCAKDYAGNPSLHDKDVLSTFIGLKLEKLTVGLEYDYVRNLFYLLSNASGFSGFISYDFTKKFEFFYRYDIFNYLSSSSYKYNIVGLQFSPNE
ncbi:MAG: hypothetical protein U9Q83_07340, partial [Bacteroidota bacterium]|nr:hypothetical protein [Bacteroidota bacterium]